MRPYITKSVCIRCEQCIPVCPYDVFSREEDSGDIVVSAPEDCIECLSCVEACPNGALHMDD